MFFNYLQFFTNIQMLKYTKILQNFHTILSWTHKSYISTFRSIPIELLEEKSHVSEVIIQEILKKRSLDEIKECTLTERIKRRVKSCDNVDQSVKEEMLDFFTDGVVSNREIFSEEVHEKQIFESSLEPDSYKIRFFPTTFMTQKVFYHLMNRPGKRLQIAPQGVGFSISLQLYCTLSNIIHQYRCQKNKPAGKFEPLFKNVTKVLFWNVNDNDEFNQIDERIQSQCPQLANFVIQNLSSRSDFYSENSNSEVIFFFDHMYRLVNQRRGGQFYKQKIDNIQYRLRNNREITPKQLEFYQTKKKQYEFFNKHFGSIASKVQKVAYEQHQQKLASAHFFIQNLNDRILRYQYDRHNSVYFNKYQYEEVLCCEDTIIQIIDYFLFELKEKIHLPIFSQGNWNDPELVVKVRNQIISQLPQNPFKDLIITPLGISNSLKTFWKSNEKQILEAFQKLNEIHAEKDLEAVWIQKVANQALKLLNKSIEFMKSEFEKEIGEFADELNVQEKLMILRAQIMGEKIEIDRQVMDEERLETDKIEKLKVLRVNLNKLGDHYLSPFIKKPAYIINYYANNSLLQNCIEKRIFYNLQKSENYRKQQGTYCYYSTGYLMKMLKLRMDDIFNHMYKRHLNKATQEVKKLEQEFKQMENNIENIEMFVHSIKENI